jgi:hypothetical protein
MQLTRAAFLAAALACASERAYGNALTLTQGTAADLSGTVSYGSGATTVLSSGTVSYDFGNSFNAPQSGSILGPNPGTCGSSPPCYGFYDDFRITVPVGGFADAVSVTINGPTAGSLPTTGVNNMQIRIYSADANASPVTGAGPINGAAYQSWLTVTNAGGGVTVSTAALGTTSPVPLLPGDSYWVEVRGIVSGASGAYGGSFNFTPVPLPAALPLLLSGLGMAGLAGRRRRGALRAGRTAGPSQPVAAG